MSTCVQKHDTGEDIKSKEVQDLLIRAFMELSYSDQRRKEMQRVGEKDCSALRSIIEEKLQKEGAENIKVLVPAEKNRFADMIFDLEIENLVLLEQLKQDIAEIVGKNVREIKTFVVKD